MTSAATSIRERVCETAKWMLNSGLTQETFGNVSCRVDDQTIAITPSAIQYPKLTPSDIALVNLDGNVIESDHKTSTETPIHLNVYQNRADVKAILHTHSPFATVFACLGKPIRPYHNTLAHAGGIIYPSEYANNGTEELAQTVVNALDGRRACLLRNHGVLAVGDSIRDARYVASIVEFCAKMQLFSVMIGNPEEVPESELSELSDHYRSQLQD
jgi:L-fuculose-phosphate aldolase